MSPSAETTPRPQTAPAAPRPTSLGKRKTRQWAAVVGIAVIAAGSVAILLRHEPSFYSSRISVADDEERRGLSREFLNKTTRLIGDMQNEHGWNESFAEDEINAWLADDFRLNYAARSLPPGVADPRIAIEADRMRLGFRYKNGPLETVVHLGFRTWVPKQNLLAVELEMAWAGSVPLPTNQVRQVVEQIAAAYNLSVAWKRNGSKLVALFDLSREYRETILEQVRIDADGLLVRGISNRYTTADFSAAPSAN